MNGSTRSQQTRHARIEEVVFCVKNPFGLFFATTLDLDIEAFCINVGSSDLKWKNHALCIEKELGLFGSMRFYIRVSHLILR